MKSSILALSFILSSSQLLAAQLTKKTQIRLVVIADSLKLDDYIFSFSAGCQKHRGLRPPVDCGSQIAPLSVGEDGVVEVPGLESDNSRYSDDLDNWTVGISMHPKSNPNRYAFGLSARGTDGVKEFYGGNVYANILRLNAAELKVELNGKDLTQYPDFLATPGASLNYSLAKPYSPEKKSNVLAIEFQNLGIIYGVPGYLVAGPLKDFVKFSIPEMIIGQVNGNLGGHVVNVRLQVSSTSKYIARQYINAVPEGMQQLKTVQLRQ